ncbi:MAG: glycosyltransferase family 4 protein [Paludibacter sp.]|nr:glycosyltransferase family 4 protein [Paludibacter sp.]MDD4198390.1 glycosyltransferase family 4 protein [Paludibacter sp.]MDD4427068.1 glycosyltransferase family 4 protein [Paludibacter sp.]
MNIIFFSSLNPNDINNWSGTTWHILKALEKNNNVTVIGTHMLSQTAYFTSKSFSIKDVNEDYSPLFGSVCSELINRISDSDLIFFGDLQLSPYLDVDIPTIHISDVNYHLFKDYTNKNRTKEQEKRTEIKEKKVLKKYTIIIYSSEWTKQNTIDYYKINPKKIQVVEFGANIPHPEKWQHEIDTSVCNLVFIGRNWVKKGGEKVLGAYRKLKSEGFSCTLTIIGSVPPERPEDDKSLTIIPFLDKSKPEHLNKLCSILKDAHFLVLPTEFDAFGIVFCEASAYGVPSIAADVGGVSQPVREGKNGFLLSPTATAEDYAEKIKSVFSDKESYIKLRASSRNQYETRLNWDVWGEKVNKILEETVSNYNKKK